MPSTQEEMHLLEPVEECVEEEHAMFLRDQMMNQQRTNSTLPKSLKLFLFCSPNIDMLLFIHRFYYFASQSIILIHVILQKYS